MVFDELATMVDSMDMNESNIELWVWVKLVGKEGHTTRLIMAYQLVRAGKVVLDCYTVNIGDTSNKEERRSA